MDESKEKGGGQTPGPGWEVVNLPNGEALFKEFDCGNFVGSVEFINRITPLAEAAFHHPDLVISWNIVHVTLMTHSELRITEKDYSLAAEIDKVA